MRRLDTTTIDKTNMIDNMATQQLPPGLPFPLDLRDFNAGTSQSMATRVLNCPPPPPAPPPPPPPPPPLPPLPRSRGSSRSGSNNVRRGLRPILVEFRLSPEALIARPGDSMPPGIPTGFGFPSLLRCRDPMLRGAGLGGGLRPKFGFKFNFSSASLTSRPGDSTEAGVPPGFGFPLLPHLTPAQMCARGGSTLPPILSLLGRPRASSFSHSTPPTPSFCITGPPELDADDIMTRRSPRTLRSWRRDDQAASDLGPGPGPGPALQTQRAIITTNSHVESNSNDSDSAANPTLPTAPLPEEGPALEFQHNIIASSRHESNLEASVAKSPLPTPTLPEEAIQDYIDFVTAGSTTKCDVPGINSVENPANKVSPYSAKRLNVESPAFTPLSLPSLPVQGRATTISSQAANAAPFTPRGLAGSSATPNNQSESEPTTFNPATIREFTPQNAHNPPSYEIPQNLSTNGAGSDSAPYDPFTMSTLNSAMPPTQYNPYLEDTNSMAGNSSAYYQAQPTFGTPPQPLQYHLYASMGPHREDLLPYQRLSHDFFMSNDLREELQKKSAATLQVLELKFDPHSHQSPHQLPTIGIYHTLVALDTKPEKSTTVFGIPSWAYKVTSSKNGHTYALRRLEGFRLNNGEAIKSVKEWKRVDNSGVVSVIDAFTTRDFGDSSLVFVYNYHPLSKTLAEHHFPPPNRYGNRQASIVIPEHQLWSYIVQLSSAIKAVHDAKLAVRCMDPSKVLLTEKNRIRLNACGILDVVRFDENRALAELQQEDFVLFGRLILAIATNNLSIYSSSASMKGPIDQLARNYSESFRTSIEWLLSPTIPDDGPKDINHFLHYISSHVVTALDYALHANDSLTSTLSSELENGRLVRLLCKLGAINERPEYEHDVKWSEVGERYTLKLFRDHVFHQVDPNGKPVVDLGHILTNLNKLDAGTNQMIKLYSRDEQTIMFVTYKELKKQAEAAWGDLTKSSPSGGGGKRF